MRSLSVMARLLAVWCAIVAAAGCAENDHAVTATAAPHSLIADSLILNVEDVQRIAKFDDLTSDPQQDTRAPGNLDAQAPAPCRAVFDQQAAFAQGWNNFRSVWYSGASNKGVTQAVGVYPDESAARNAFGRASSDLAACAALHADGYNFTTQTPTPSTVEVCFEKCRVVYRWQSSVLIDVSVQHFSDADRIAAEVVKAIADRINGA